ncbi:hypothetical protein [Poseidonibacter lekithochrous]|nr:hypothetical protein [Poseidonibacter lekithochrous]
MDKLNINETRLYKKNLSIHKNLPKVYVLALVVALVITVIKGFN